MVFRRSVAYPAACYNELDPVIAHNQINLYGTVFLLHTTYLNNFIYILTMASGDYRVADISLADFGRREIEIAEHEVSLLQCNLVSVALTIMFSLFRCLD